MFIKFQTTNFQPLWGWKLDDFNFIHAGRIGFATKAATATFRASTSAAAKAAFAAFASGFSTAVITGASILIVKRE
jgi:hypothetical protein